jgi:lipoate-protein ligase B
VGLWTEKGKIGFCGIRVKNGITQHGIALNLDNDLTLFEQITSCGRSNTQFDKLNSHYKVSSFDFFKCWCEVARGLRGQFEKMS